MHQYNIVRFFVLSMLTMVVSCGSFNAQLNTKNVGTPEVTTIPATLESDVPKWETLRPSIDADIMVVSGNELLLVGKEGVAKLLSDLTFQKLPTPKRMEQHFSRDGGLTISTSIEGSAKSNISPFSVDRMCWTESALINDKRFLSTGPCEHTSQLRAYTFSDNNDLIKLIDFTYSKDSTDDDPKVYGPGMLFSDGNHDYMTAASSNGPIILQIDAQTLQRKIIWKKQTPKYTSILSVVRVDGQSYMLTSDGMILRSENDVTNWKFFSKIPSEFIGKVFDLQFRNSTEAYVIGAEGILLVSHDGGKSWSRQPLNTSGSLYKISFDTDRLAILVDFKTFLVSENGSEWSELNVGEDIARIADIQFHDHKLFVLTPDRIFVNSFDR